VIPPGRMRSAPGRQGREQGPVRPLPGQRPASPGRESPFARSRSRSTLAPHRFPLRPRASGTPPRTPDRAHAGLPASHTRSP
jgi:hypothetical protein